MRPGERLLVATAIDKARELYELELHRGRSDIEAGLSAYRLLRCSGEQS
jgi:hypothetical protein